MTSNSLIVRQASGCWPIRKTRQCCLHKNTKNKEMNRTSFLLREELIMISIYCYRIRIYKATGVGQHNTNTCQNHYLECRPILLLELHIPRGKYKYKSSKSVIGIRSTTYFGPHFSKDRCQLISWIKVFFYLVFCKIRWCTVLEELQFCVEFLLSSAVTRRAVTSWRKC